MFTYMVNLVLNCMSSYYQRPYNRTYIVPFPTQIILPPHRRGFRSALALGGDRRKGRRRVTPTRRGPDAGLGNHQRPAKAPTGILSRLVDPETRARCPRSQRCYSNQDIRGHLLLLSRLVWPNGLQIRPSLTKEWSPLRSDCRRPLFGLLLLGLLHFLRCRCCQRLQRREFR